MELWIRSQDKETLLKVNKVEYEYYKPFWSDYRIDVIKLNDSIIQEYKTKERALEVLDEIQKIINWCQTEMRNVTFGDTKNLKGCFDDYVYEMPEE